MGAYCLIGKSTPIELQVACFYSPSMLHVRIFPRTSDSFERCLTEEYANNNFLCDEPKLFVFHDDEDRISLNIDYELSPMTRIHVGFEQISFENLSNGFFERPSFHFELPDFQLNSQVSFAVHVDLYQSKHLDDAFHARLLIDPIRVRSFADWCFICSNKNIASFRLSITRRTTHFHGSIGNDRNRTKKSTSKFSHFSFLSLQSQRYPVNCPSSKKNR